MSSHIFPRPGCSDLPLAVSGDGIYLIDADGKRYLDGCGGAAVSCLGHSNAAVRSAIQEQVGRLAYAHTSFFTSAAAEELAARLAASAPGAINRAYFVSGGSEAIETAIKLARQYYVATGQEQRCYIIGRRQSYHGNTLGALAAGYNPLRRACYAPLLSDAAHHVDACHYWRGGQNGESAQAYGERLAQQLEEKILQLGADKVMAFIAETVVGATLGAVAAVPGYFHRVREICNRYGILLILDEVMCGMGRTGALFACEQEEVIPDIVCIAKGLGAGMQPLGAMLCDEKIYTAVSAGGGFEHGHTYLAHITACAAGLAVLNEISQQDLLTNVCRQGDYLYQSLQQRLGAHPHIGDIRGRGLFYGIEFVQQGKEPFPRQQQVHKQIKRHAMACGLMVYAMGGAADGEQGDHILLAPPFIVNREQVDELVDKLSAALTEVLGEG